MKRFFLICLAYVMFCGFSNGQGASDTINKTDSKGKKQGYWKKYSGDTLKYEGTFKDDKPVGKMTHYYADKKIKAVSEFSKDGKFCSAILYFPSGKKEAEGFYTNSKKDSVWKYYTEKDTLISEEHYKNCVQHGVWKFYYSDGIINQEVTWVNGVRNGPWKMYYSDGKKKLDCNIINNKKEGLFKAYYPGGKIYMSGMYKNGLKEGVWMKFTELGEGETKETYNKGYLEKTEDLKPGSKK